MSLTCLLLNAAAYFLLDSSVFAADILDGHKSKLACQDCHGDGQKKPVSKEKCLSCHKSYEDLGKQTSNIDPNPHHNHVIDIDCNRCHRTHEASQIYCVTCHEGMTFKKSAK
jgi:fumarate reductase flavoprotein subunit